MRFVKNAEDGANDRRVLAAAARYRRIQSALDEWSELVPFPGEQAVGRVEDALWEEREEALRDAASAGPVGPAAMTQKVLLWLDAYGENAEPNSQALVASLIADLDDLTGDRSSSQNARRAFSAAASVPSSR